VAADKAKFKESPGGGTSMAVLWGDPDKVSRNFHKVPAGYEAGLHTHTSDVWITVIKGAYSIKTMEAKSVWVRAIFCESRAATSIRAVATDGRSGVL